MNQSRGKHPLFDQPAAFAFFLSLVALEVERGRIRLHAYCVMDTHFHALIESVDCTMSAALQQIESRYCAAFNQRMGVPGSPLGGRFLSVRIESEIHLLTVIGYIDMNPVAANICPRPTDYPHSSAQALATGRRIPRWLDPTIVNAFLDTHQSGKARFDQYRKLFHWDEESTHKVVTARLSARASEEDALTQLLWGTDAWRRNWLVGRARDAHGVVKSSPYVDAQSVQQAIGRANTDFRIPGTRCAPERIATVALLRDLCALGFEDISAFLKMGKTTAWSLYQRHAKHIKTSRQYAELVVLAASSALRGCYGDGLGIRRAREMAESDFLGARRESEQKEPSESGK